MIPSEGAGFSETQSDGEHDGDNFTVYVVECSDGSLYTGQTNDLERRIKQHNRGNGGSYTSARTPVTLVYTERYATRAGAMRRETTIKSYSRAEKEDLVGYHGS